MSERTGQTDTDQYKIKNIGPKQTPSEVHEMVTADQPDELAAREQKNKFGE
ncbi:hypothetical protein [Fictibacillus terranigra]|uniref:Uncharacterized protein n=1 Tax=Fictibacillus terranigra TaxID=3058424 RepID=A0ABT8E8Z6_9BACL|nr:hypothetical protein [Fictibacillus sp. CENA-BCM004]MDN4074370.1 hypothetical protein [Fictibacillus sp. CENA-BCM004]